jgi:hypothetical protein
VKEGEQEHERRVGLGSIGKEGEGRSGDPLPMAFAVYGGVLTRGSRKDGVHESCGVRYGDTCAGTHISYQRFRRRAFADGTAVDFSAARQLVSPAAGGSFGGRPPAGATWSERGYGSSRNAGCRAGFRMGSRARRKITCLPSASLYLGLQKGVLDAQTFDLLPVLQVFGQETVGSAS